LTVCPAGYYASKITIISKGKFINLFSKNAKTPQIIFALLVTHLVQLATDGVILHAKVVIAATILTMPLNACLLALLTNGIMAQIALLVIHSAIGMLKV
jgi:hypothetical protein